MNCDIFRTGPLLTLNREECGWRRERSNKILIVFCAQVQDKECKTVPKQICTEVPKTVPTTICKNVPREVRLSCAF